MDQQFIFWSTRADLWMCVNPKPEIKDNLNYFSRHNFMNSRGLSRKTAIITLF